MPAPDSAQDRLAVIETCTLLHWSIDRKDWAGMAAVLADEVRLPSHSDVYDDHTAPDQVRARPRHDVVRGSQALMDGIVTQHLVTGHHVSISGDRATCEAHSINVHVGAAQVSDNRLVNGNLYRFELQRSPEGWRIDALAVERLWSMGNEAVHSNAARQAALYRSLDEPGSTPNAGPKAQ